MSSAEMPATDAEVANSKPQRPLVYRQSAWTRVTHWIWAVTIIVMIGSGLNIFMARPDLYIGHQSGFDFDNAILDIGAMRTAQGPRGYTTVFGHRFDTTGWLGLFGDNPRNWQARAFPTWLTIPNIRDLATGRVVHFFFAWVLFFTLLVWLIASIVNGHAGRDLVPRGRDIRRLPRDIADHVRLRFHHGRSYNVLQKLSYFVVLFIFLPLMFLTGLSMSPGMDSFMPWLPELFGGRQTARTIHFAIMLLLVLFFVVHILMVLLAGPFNELRSMITGWYRADASEGGE